MNRQYRIEEGGVFLALDVSEKGEVSFLHCQRRPFVEETIVPEQKEWVSSGGNSGRRGRL